MASLDGDQCTSNVGVIGGAVEQRFCTKGIKASDWNRNHSIIIQAREEEHHYYSASYTVQLTTEEHFHHPIWGHYRLPDIQVYMLSLS